MRQVVLLLTLLLLAGCTNLLPPREQPATEATPVAIGEDGAVRELALRLLTPRYPGAPEPEEVQLLTAELPPSLPVEMPLPDGAQVIGSLVRGEEETEIILDAPQSPDEVVSFYKERLTTGGWEMPEAAGQPSGFVSSGVESGASFCQEEADVALWVYASESERDMTDVRLNLSDARNSVCNLRMGPGDLDSPIPVLAAPRGARQMSAGGGSSGDAHDQSATLDTELSSAELATHYAEQLEAAGWTRQDEGAAGPIAWSRWQVEDDRGDQWHGLFFVIEIPGQLEKRFAYIRVDLTE